MRDARCEMRDAGCGMRDAGCGMWDVGCGMWDVGCWLAFLSMETDSPDTVLEGSTVIWAIMAVTALWLLGLFVMAIGYTLFECLGPCTTPAQPWVWWDESGDRSYVLRLERTGRSKNDPAQLGVALSRPGDTLLVDRRLLRRPGCRKLSASSVWARWDARCVCG